MEKSIEEMLRDGISATELRTIFEKEIVDAENKIKQEDEGKEIFTARNKMIDAMLEYGRALGMIDDSIDINEERETISNLLIKMEDKAKAVNKLFNMLDEDLPKKAKCGCGLCEDKDEDDLLRGLLDELLK